MSGNSSKVMNIGIMSLEDYRDRTIAIVRGEYKVRPDEPKLWFQSIRRMSEILSEKNRDLLRVIHEREPETLKELSDMTGRQVSNLSRTLKTMENCGIVELERNGRRVKPLVKATRFRVEFRI
jgi:predicted transcriptional regulator